MLQRLFVYSCLLTGHMMTVEKETSIMTGKRTGGLVETVTLTRRRGEGAQVGIGQRGMVLKAGKPTKAIQPSSWPMRKEQSWV